MTTGSGAGQKARAGTLIGGDGGRLSWINRERSVTISLRQTVQRKYRSGKGGGG